MVVVVRRCCGGVSEYGVSDVLMLSVFGQVFWWLNAGIAIVALMVLVAPM
ncbi:hypothetical protein A2U01_0069577, partial [Trifolium medium]|nr:hypothetical protein [Trifolium medium]